MRKEVLDIFIKKFKNVDYAYKDEIFDFFSDYYPNLSNSTFLWRLFELKDKGIITKISNDMYQINDKNYKNSFSLPIQDDIVTKTLMKFNEPLDNRHSYKNDEKMICTWDLSILNSFTSHQYSKEIVFVEIDKYRIEELFFELKDKLSDKYYISKEYNKDYDHIALEERIIMINALVKRAPLEKRYARLNHYIVSPKLEKILVDIIANKEIFTMYDKASIKEIFLNSYEKYNLDFTTLLYYAKNRGIRKTVRLFISQVLGVKLDDK
jgi:hypothetical protein